MKRCLLVLVVLFVSITFFSGSALAVECDATDEATLNAGITDCDIVRVTADILLSGNKLIDGSKLVTEIYGVGEPTISAGAGINHFTLSKAGGINVHDLAFEGVVGKYVFVLSSSGNEIYDNTFNNCGTACIWAVFADNYMHENTFTIDVGGPIDAASIFQHTADPAPATPTLSADAMSSYTGWALSGSTPGDVAGTVDLYTITDTAITPLAIDTTAVGDFSFSITFASQLPDGVSFVGLFSESGTDTSAFSDTFTGSFDAGFFGTTYADCNVAWFKNSADDQSAGDYDGDGLANSAEDADANCAVASTETNPALADTDEDGYCDGSVAVNNGTETCAASDNCPLVANADQADADSDGVGDACSDVVNNPPTASTLSYPSDGAIGVPTEFTISWYETTDPDGDTVTYQLFVCTDEDFVGCDAIYNSAASISLNSLDLNNRFNSDQVFLFLGVIAAGGLFSSRRRKWILVALILSLSALSTVSCGGGGGGTPVDTPDIMEYSITSLESSTTYFWKVTVTDSNGGSTDSEVRSFTTL
jgi:hypothetical protein